MIEVRNGITALGRRLGRRGTAAVALALLAAVAIAAVAIAGRGSPPRRARLALSGAPPPTTSGSTGRLPILAVRKPPARRHHRGSPHRAGSARHPAHRATATSQPRSTSTTTSASTSTATSTTTTPAVTVLLALHGGGDASLSACGAMHHFRTYPAGASVSFSGSVQPAPSPQWKVKLHIKVCQGGQWVDFTKLDAHGHHSGAFDGTFPAPRAGLYEVRAVLYFGTTESTESDKTHVETR